MDTRDKNLRQEPNWGAKPPSEWGMTGSRFGTTCVVAIVVNLVVAAILLLTGVSVFGTGIAGFTAWACVLTVGELLLAMVSTLFQPQA